MKREGEFSWKAKGVARILTWLLFFCESLGSIALSFTVTLRTHDANAMAKTNRLRASRLHESEGGFDGEYKNKEEERPPIPAMPSDLFRQMAHSQLQLLANSLSLPGSPSESKVESMAVYLPQENVNTGQLEFTPAVLYPDPSTERVFIASDAASGQAPNIPRTLPNLPGFAHATSLLPGYPMISSSDELNPGVGVVEEVMCDARFKNKPAALSVPLLSGSQTVGVLLVSPVAGEKNEEYAWTDFDRLQVSTAAQSLSMALSMDNERNFLKTQNTAFREGLSNSLHQVKNPLQALRTYGKVLQLQIAKTEEQGGTLKLLELTERLMVQSERVVDLINPMDSLVQGLEGSSQLALNPAKDDSNSLALWEAPLETLPWENETLEFARGNASEIELIDGASTERKSNQPKQREQKKNYVQRSAGVISTVSVSPTSVVGDLEMEMTFVADILDPIFSGFQAIALDRGIRFDVVEESDLPGVMAAPKSLQEAVCNVLDNAFKYVVLPNLGSPFLKNPSPWVRVRMLGKEDFPGVVLLVEDNGPGIRHEDKDKIFQRGFRGTATDFVEGTGLGLDISQALLRRMGGSIEVADPREIPNSLDGTIMKITLFRQPKS